MAKNVCILLNQYGELSANAAMDAFQFGAVSAEMGNRTVVYLGAHWHQLIIPRGHLEKQEKGFLGSLMPTNPLLLPVQRFQAVGGALWVPAQATQDYKPGGVIDGVTFVDERTLLEFLAEDTITLQF